jgi:hypothetical protein
MKISPKDFGTMVFLGKDLVRCKMFVGKTFWQHVKNCKHLGCKICNENERNIHQILTKLAKILGSINSSFKSNLVQKILRIYCKYLMHRLSSLSYMKTNFGPLRKDKQRLTSSELKFLRRTAGYTIFNPKRKEETLENFK